MSIWSFIDRWAGAKATEPDHLRWRGRFIASLSLLGAAASIVTGIALLFTGALVDAAITPVGAAFCLGLLWTWRKWKRAAIPANAFAAFCTVLYFAAFVVHRELSAVAWLAITPMLALFLGGRKLGVIWAVIEALLIGAAVVISNVYPQASIADEMNTSAALLRMSSLMLVVFTVAVVFDLSGQSVLDRLIEASNAKSRFLANVSHELRTPLNGVLGMAELMAQNELSPAQRERLATILETGQHLRLLIDDVLDTTQLDRGELQIHEGPTSPHEVAATVLKQLQTLADNKTLSLSLETPGESLVMRTDGLRLMQIVSNLVGNAIKFTERGGVVVVVQTAREANNVRLVLEVRDTGPGIPSGEQEAIFKPFTRLKRDATVAGTGLGLSIVKTIGELLGGKISVRSEAGQGATFRFELVRPIEVLVKAVELPPVVALHGPRVLLVDDNNVNLKVARGLLEKLGCQVTSAADGAQAVERFQSGQFDLVLMDLHMPVLDGFESAQKIRALDAAVKIIALSATTVREELDRVTLSGMNGYLSKPVRLEQLRDALPTLVPARRSA
ncbi:MAG: ATP-binding protein [Archangium sp.]